MRHFATRTRQFLTLGAIFLMMASAVSIAQSSSRPSNLRIVREDSGGANDRLVAHWDPPSDGNVDQYFFRRSYRFFDSPNTDHWSTASILSGTTRVIGNTPILSAGEWVDVRIEVSVFFWRSSGKPSIRNIEVRDSRFTDKTSVPAKK